ASMLSVIRRVLATSPWVLRQRVSPAPFCPCLVALPVCRSRSHAALAGHSQSRVGARMRLPARRTSPALPPTLPRPQRRSARARSAAPSAKTALLLGAAAAHRPSRVAWQPRRPVAPPVRVGCQQPPVPQNPPVGPEFRFCP